MKNIALALSLLVIQHASGQHANRILIPAGSLFSEVITPAKMYRYPAFQTGTILFKDNVMFSAKLNYNLFNGEIMFISNPKNDTLAIAKEQMLNIKKVTIDSNSYVYNKGYLQIVTENKMGSLLKKQQYVVVAREKIGGYNMPSSTDAIDSYSFFIDQQNNIRNLTARENIKLELRTFYYLGDSYNSIQLINRKSVSQITKRKKSEVDSYLKEHNVDFKNEEDLKVLFNYLTQSPA